MARAKNEKPPARYDEIANRLNISDARRKKSARRVIQDCIGFVRNSFPYERRQEVLGPYARRIKKLRNLEKALEECSECLEESWELTVEEVSLPLLLIIKLPPSHLSNRQRVGYWISNQRKSEVYLESTRTSLHVFREALHRALDQKQRPRVGRPSNRYTVISLIQGCSEVFEWLTGTIATRRIRGKDHSQRGAPYGPFHDFIVQIWELADRNTAEIANGLRDWSRLKKQDKVSKGFFDQEYFSQKK